MSSIPNKYLLLTKEKLDNIKVLIHTLKSHQRRLGFWEIQRLVPIKQIDLLTALDCSLFYGVTSMDWPTETIQVEPTYRSTMKELELSLEEA